MLKHASHTHFQKKDDVDGFSQISRNKIHDVQKSLDLGFKFPLIVIKLSDNFHLRSDR